MNGRRRAVVGRARPDAQPSKTIRANSKNRMGAYVGQRSVGIVLRGGKVVHTVDQGEFAGGTINSGDILCKNAQFEPITI